MDTPLLGPGLEKRIALLFPPHQREEVRTRLTHECGNNLPFLQDRDQDALDRFRYAALKLSEGDLMKLDRAIRLAQRDWRDLLVAAGFATRIEAHHDWLPEQRWS